MLRDAAEAAANERNVDALPCQPIRVMALQGAVHFGYLALALIHFLFVLPLPVADLEWYVLQSFGVFAKNLGVFQAGAFPISLNQAGTDDQYARQSGSQIGFHSRVSSLTFEKLVGGGAQNNRWASKVMIVKCAPHRLDT